MKPEILVAAVLLCLGAASAFTSFIQAGTAAARGAIHAGTSFANTGLGKADTFGSVIPGVSTAVGMARSGTNAATSMSNSGLQMVDGAASLANLMQSIMSSPWVVWIMGICSRVMATMNS